ncbi:unnamed protein product, partial [Meganyctiphanes norvegica]
GAAFYRLDTSQLYVLEDKVEAPPEFWVLRTLYRELNPRWVVIGGRLDDRLFSVLRELGGIPATPVTGISSTPTSSYQGTPGNASSSDGTPMGSIGSTTHK